MRMVIGVLCFILVVFASPVELLFRRSSATVYPPPIQLHVNHYGRLLCPYELPAGFYKVGTDENNENIIGVIFEGFLVLLLAPREDLSNDYGRVKVRIDGNTANVTLPITIRDPANKRFFTKFGRKHVRNAEIRALE